MSILAYRQTIAEILLDGEPWSKLDLELECERRAEELAVGHNSWEFEKTFERMIETKDIVRLTNGITRLKNLYHGKCTL